MKERQLTSLIFGGEGGVDGSVASNDDSLKDRTAVIRKAKAEVSSPGDVAKDPQNDGALWQDPDDSTIQVSANFEQRLRKLRSTRQDASWNNSELEQLLRQRYEKTAAKASASTEWASLKALNSKSEKDAIQAESGMIFSRKANSLPSNIIDIVRLKDVNSDDACGAVLRCAEFYKNSDPDEPVLMTAGLDRCMKFYQINKEDEAKKIHGIHCKFLSM